MDAQTDRQTDASTIAKMHYIALHSVVHIKWKSKLKFVVVI